jgi:quercetin dioxygenase-like cupin family protein
MEIFRLSQGVEEVADSPLFTGPAVIRKPVATGQGPHQATVVRFGRGVRNKFHRHSTDQILLVTEGSGIIATEAEEFEITVGDVVIVPEGETHWHGANPDSEMAHVVILGSGATVTQLED